MRLIFGGKWLNIQSLPLKSRIMKNGSICLFSFVFWLFCLSKVQGSNLSLVLGYTLEVNKTEIKISQVENSQPLTIPEKVSIELKSNYVIIQDTTNKALLLSVKSGDDYEILKLFKEKCLDNLNNSSCLDEFVEKFYTLFDPFGLEYQFFVGNKQILAKLVKDISSNELKIATQVTNVLYLQSPDVLSGSVKIYDISSGREVLNEKLDYGQNSLDLSRLRNGAYVLVYNKKSLKFVKL